jgi:hypothetical protein
MSSETGTFVRVACSCGRTDIYLKCDRCGRQSLFEASEEGVRCQCGATYTHGVCACGKDVGPEGLVAVPFEEGPMVASELELDPKRLVAIVVVVLLVLGAGGLWWLR